MSASRDDSSNVFSIVQKITNKTSNQLGKGKNSSKVAKSPASKGLQSGRVIKAGDLNAAHGASHSSFDALASSLGKSAGQASVTPSVQVNPYIPSELAGNRVARPNSLPPTSVLQSHQALESLKQNFKALNELQERLRFMLKELEELVK